MINFRKENTYLNNALITWKKIKEALLSYQGEYIYSDNVFACAEKDKLYIQDNGLSVSMYYASDNVIKARSIILVTMEEYVNTIKKMASLFVINGYDGNSSDSDHYLGGIIIDDTFYKCSEASLKEHDSAYEVTITFGVNVVNAIEKYFDEFHLISSLIAPSLCGVVLLQGDRPEVSEKGKMMKEKLSSYNLTIPSSSLTAKEKFAYLESLTPLIMEINHKNVTENTVRIKNCFNDEVCECADDETEETLNKLSSYNDTALYRKSFEISYEISKRENSPYGVKYLCNEELCINSLKSSSEALIVPFNQRIRNKKCSLCGKEASKKIIVLGKNE